MNEEPDNPYDLPPEPISLGDRDFAPTQDERNIALIAHLSGIAGIVMGGLLGFLGPLLVYLIKKDDSPYIAAQAKEALNFQITVLIIGVACAVLAMISCGTLFLLLFVPAVMQVVFGIIAALAVRDGSHYRYPVNLRLIQ
ncbi:MAG: DUF4870 domain-containing protein [Rubripirellula sp.]